MYPTINHITYVTGFEKTQLPNTQQQDTFHHHVIAVYTSKHFMQLSLLKVAKTAYSVLVSEPCQTSKSVRVNLDPLDKKPAGYKSLHNWLVRLILDLAFLCVMRR